MIRRFIKGDEKEIAKIEKECFSSPWSESAILSSVEEGAEILVYVKNRKTVGYVGLLTSLDEGYIANLGVKEECRREGIGQALVSAVLERADGLALSFVSLEVRVSNSAAISLYEKMGFEKVGVRPKFYTLPNEDAFIMTKRRKI